MHYLRRSRSPSRRKVPGAAVGWSAAACGDRPQLCMNPSIMLFDEPTSALDPEMIKEVLDTMVSGRGAA
jgi:general L-amino acid transport system ATP-binding protein